MLDTELKLPFRILVVDEEDTARSVRRIAQSDDVVMNATDAETACQLITKNEGGVAPFDVVLCKTDIDEAHREKVFRAVRAYAEPPIFIYMTSYADDRNESLPPADGILIKPFTQQELDDLIFKAAVQRSRERTRRLLSKSYN